MKRMALGFFLAAFAAVACVGCSHGDGTVSEVTGTFHCSSGEYLHTVTLGEAIVSPLGASGLLRFEGEIDVRIVPLAQLSSKGCCEGPIAIGVGLFTIGVAGIASVVSSCNGSGGMQEAPWEVEPLTEDVRVYFGDDFWFDLLVTGPCPGDVSHNGTVPNLAGMTQDQVVEALSGTCFNLNPTVTMVTSATVPVGHVVDWSPKDTVPCGIVSIVLSSGPGQVTVPDLTGLNLAQARVRLSAVGLTNGDGDVATASSPTVPVGIISGWNPRGTVNVGSAIHVIVSTGPENVDVPDLTGLTRAQAESAIGATCLVVGTVTEVFNATIPAGIVVSWSPTGTQPCGTAIDLAISKGPEPQATFGLSVSSPDDGITVLAGETVTATCAVTGPNPVRLVLVSPEGEFYAVTVAPPATVSHRFTLTLEGTGLISFRAVDTVTGEEATLTRSITVTLPKG